MNSRGYTVTSIAIAFMAVTLLSVPGFGGNAYAEHTNANINHELIGIASDSGGVGMSLSVDANAGSHSIMISGSTDRSVPVMIIVTAPNGNVVAIDQVTPSGNSYSATIGVGGSQYNQDGMYTILVQQGAQSGDTTYNSLNLLTDYQGGHLGKYKFAAQVEVTSGTTSATSISKSSCYGTCNYDPSAPIMSGGVSDGRLTITADAVLGSTTIDVSGTTTLHSSVMLKVIAPNGNVVAIDQVTPSGNSYSATIGVGGSQYNQDGMYTIIATQSTGSIADTSGPSSVVNDVLISHPVYQSITASTEVEVVDGHVIPEFGTIAAMILVVAIVAIIAVSAKTKLSLVPKY
jgi:predicted secreted protein with PEFG-CTERM motif